MTFVDADIFANVSRETMERISTFEDLLRRWNARINLVSPADLPHLRARHTADSAQLLDHAPEAAGTWLDLGSGAGFPGLICAILAAEKRPGLRFVLIESDQRKAAFLREAARITGIRITLHVTRIEATTLAPHDVISARALAPLPRLLSLAWPFCHSGTTLLFPKGRGVSSELTQAREHWHMKAETLPSRIDPDSTILRLTQVRPLS